MPQAIDARQIKRLLIRGTNWVGDAVMSLPALKQVRQLLPQARISLLVLPWVGGIYEDSPHIDELILYDRNGAHRGVFGRLRLIQEIRRKGFDAALLFQNAFEAALLASLSGIPIRAGYDRDGRGWLLSHPIPVDPRIRSLHQAYYYLDLVDQLLTRPRIAVSASSTPRGEVGYAFPMPDITLRVSLPRQEIARQKLMEQGMTSGKKVVGVNPGAAFGSAKRWLDDRFGQLLDLLIEKQNVEVAIFGSTNELGIAESIRAEMRNKPFIFAGQTQLAELIAMISLCHLFITNDSGPMHLAAALRIPTLAIFGSTDEIATGPLSPSAVIIKKKVECSPCLLRECPIDHRCMTAIHVDDVYAEAEHLLALRDVAGEWLSGSRD